MYLAGLIAILAFAAMLIGYGLAGVRFSRRNWRGTAYPLAKCDMCDKPGDVLRNGAAICKGCRSGFYGPVSLQEIAPKLAQLTEESDLEMEIRRQWK